VPIENEPALTDALAALIADPAAARQRATNARRRVETDLSFDTRMEKVERIYEELIATARR
jgi:glycosyltransferase involved in cell wall biosynthesis